MSPAGGVCCSGGGLSAPRGWGGVCSWGVSTSGGVSASGGCGIPACTEADSPIPTPRGQTDACKNITLATSLRTVIKMSTLLALCITKRHD